MNESISVLLVEDNPGDARLVREALSETEGATVQVAQARSLAEVQALLVDNKFDIILLDPGLPDATGFEGLMQVQHAAPRLPILVLTGNDDEDFAIEAIRGGAQDYVVKGDLTGDSLMRTIRYVLGRHRSLSQRAELLSAFALSLRTLVEELKQSVEALEGDATPSDSRRQMLARITSAAEGLRALRDAIAETARSESGALRPELRGLGASALIAVIKSDAVGGDHAPEIPDSRHLDVLLVEDNRGDARLVAEALRDTRRVEASLTQAISVSEAVQRITHDRFDVVLLDLGLPDAFGLEAVGEVHRGAPNIAIVVLTGTDDDSMAMGALKRGAQDYLVKGRADPETLARSLRYAVERQRASNLCGELLEGLACELRRPVHVILGNLCLLHAAGFEDQRALTKAAELAYALYRFSDAAIEVARSEKMRDVEAGVVAAMADLRRGASQRTLQAAENAAELLRAPELLQPSRDPSFEEPKVGGLLGRFLQRVQPKKKRVLVCDADHDSRALARAILETTDYDAVEAGDASEAPNLLAAGNLDVAIVHMPDNGVGADLLDRIRQAAGGRVALVFTYDRPADSDARRKPSEHMLAKPFTPHQLLFALAHLREGR